MDCAKFDEKLPLYLYEELTAEEQAEVQAHLAACPRCAAAAEELRRLQTALNERPVREPSPALLVRCRWELEEALDREATSWRALVRSWMEPRQAASRLATALTILLVGFSLGWTLNRPGVIAPGPNGASAPWIGADLANVRVNGISQVVPDPQTGDVRITLDAQRRVTLEGSLDDPRIQQLLLDAVRQYDNPGIRLTSLEALRARSGDPSVRDALLYAMRRDPNAGVRLEAVKSVRPMADQYEVRKALLDVLEHDTNPGVRVEVISVLVEHADQDVLPVLEELAHNDRNPYVRLQCARAVQRLAREDF